MKPKALHALQRRADRGDLEATRDLRDLTQRAEQGDAEAQHAVGLIHDRAEEGSLRRFFGRLVGSESGRRFDDTEAASWYRKAAEQGLAEAQVDLGRMYQQGRGVPHDDAEAVKWFRKASGSMVGKYCLGECYLNGTGVSKDNVQAYAWFSVAYETEFDSLDEVFAAEREIPELYDTARAMSSDEIAEARQLARKWSQES